MMHKKPFFTLLFLLLATAVVACARTGTGGPSASITNADAQATIAANAARTQATQAAQSAAQSTRNAETMATADAVAMRATDTSIEATRQSLALSSDAATSTAVWLATRDASALEQAAILNAATERESQNAIMVRWFWNVLIGMAALVVICFVAALAWRLLNVRVNAPAVTHYDTGNDGNGHTHRVILVRADRGGISGLLTGPQYAPVAPNVAQPMLPANADAPEEASAAERERRALSGPRYVTAPPWRDFIRTFEHGRVPIGVSEHGNMVHVDRRQAPHIFVSGATGTGKSSSFLRPMVAGMIGDGLHVITYNFAGSDLSEAASLPNTTAIPMLPDQHKIAALDILTDAIRDLTFQRDAMLKRENVSNWHELRNPDSGELAIVIDEAIQLLHLARKEDKELADSMTTGLIALTSTARKYGIFLVWASTDSTARALSSDGITMRDQCAAVLFRMNNAAAARAAMNQPKGQYPDGTASFDGGEFLFRVGPNLVRVRGFHPSPDDVRHFVSTQRPRPNPLPTRMQTAVDRIMALAGHAPTHAPTHAPDAPMHIAPVVEVPIGDVDGNGQSDALLLPDTDAIDATAESDGMALDGIIWELNSLRAVGRRIYYGTHEHRGPDGYLTTISGQMIESRVKPALEWRVRARACPKSRDLLESAAVSQRDRVR